MYEAFFEISKNPFSLTPDPAFLYLTPEHREAIAGLTYAILQRKGIAVLTGDAGTGKTTLLRAVMASIPGRLAHFGYVPNPALSRNEFFRFVLGDLGLDAKDSDKDQFLLQLNNYLVQAHKTGAAVVLVVDEAHRLSPELLEEIRLLANYETDTEKLLQILLVGQDELDALLDRRDLRQIKQRVAIRLRIDELTPEQVSEYVLHRWSIASSRPLPFDAGALKMIVAYSGGNPRVINSLCDNALLDAFARACPAISAEVITEVAGDLHLALAQPKAADFSKEAAAARHAGPSSSYMTERRRPFRIGTYDSAVAKG